MDLHQSKHVKLHRSIESGKVESKSASEAANAKPGQDYQVLVRGHQPRALVTPVQALLVPSVHVTAPRVAHL